MIRKGLMGPATLPLLALLFIVGVAPPSGALAGETNGPIARDGQRDFDYLVGSWNIHLKRRLRPLTGSNEWIEFDGTVTCRQIWNGHAQVEEFIVDSVEKNIHIHGLAVRLYNASTHEWSISWANERNGAMDSTAQVGHFENGVGNFFAQDTLNDRPILVRFRWTNTDTPRPHFEQAFSADGGKTWEVNWVTEQTRVSDGGTPSR